MIKFTRPLLAATYPELAAVRVSVVASLFQEFYDKEVEKIFE